MLHFLTSHPIKIEWDTASFTYTHMNAYMHSTINLYYPSSTSDVSDINLPSDLWIKVAQHGCRCCDEYLFNALVRAVPRLGRYTIAADVAAERRDSVIIDRRLDLMIKFGYTLEFSEVLRDNRICWKRYGGLHRNDVPSVVYISGRILWHKRGRLHRRDGAAITCPNGRHEWWIYGQQYTK